MFEQKRQYPFSKKHEEKGLGANVSEQDIQIEVSTVHAPTHQVNAIEPTIKRINNNNTTPTTVSGGIATNNNFSLMRYKETDLTTRVRNAGGALYDSVHLSMDKAMRKSIEKAKEVAIRDISQAAIEAKKDAQDIAALGDSVEGLARTFESLMTEIRKRPYSQQVNLLTGYKKLLKEQNKVVDSRINMAKRLK